MRHSWDASGQDPGLCRGGRGVRRAPRVGAGVACASLLVIALAACTSASSGRVGAATRRVTAAEAERLLAQASFGPNADAITRVMDLGFEGWIDEQLA